MPLSRYMISFPDPERPDAVILYSTRKSSTVRLSQRLYAAAMADALSNTERDTLRRLMLWCDDPAAERAEMAGLIDHTNANSSTFAATIVLTLDCNLACPYCFEGHFRENIAMSEETAALLVEYVTREQLDRGRDVELRFYGGEPLMALPRLAHIARSLGAAAAHVGRKFSFTLVTNATLLTPDVVAELLPLGLTSAQITLDGTEDIHNRQRPFVSGRGSFAPILANLKAVYRDVLIKPGGNFTRENYREFPAMLDALLAAGMDPALVGPVQFSPILPKSGKIDPHSAACVASSEPWLIEAILHLRGETLRRGFAVEKPNMGVCMIEIANSMVVNHDGSLYKCPALLGWPELSIGTLADGITDYRESHRLDIWKNDECLDCAYLPLCFGGCRLLSYMNHGRIDSVECRRSLFDASLERMVLQYLGLERVE
jgi:uncharacterized protein